MKVQFIILFILFFFKISGQPMINIQTETFIQGTAKESFISCDDKLILKESNSDGSTWTSIPHATFKVVKGKRYRGQEAILSFTTDPKGNFLFSLEPGIYSIVEFDRPEKYSRKKNQHRYLWDTKNLNTKWSQAILSFSVKIGDPILLDLKLLRCK